MKSWPKILVACVGAFIFSASSSAPAGAVAPPRLIPTLFLTIVEYSYSPDPGIPVNIGADANWQNNGTLTHTATQDGPLHLFDTGPISPTFTGDANLPYAGTFPYHCIFHPTLLRGTLEVPIETFPTTGGTSTTFNLAWGTLALPKGDVFRLQTRRNGGRWNSLVTRSRNTSMTLSQTGIYDFRVREEKKVSPSKHAGWSPLSAITVS